MKYLRSILIVAVCIFVSGCFNEKERAGSGSGFTSAQIVRTRGTIVADNSYEFVNPRWIPGFYSRYRSELSRRGIVEWNQTFDCNRFSAFFVALAQVEYFSDSFHSRNRHEALGIGEIWYITRTGTAHSIVFVVLPGGEIKYIEPQSGDFIDLTHEEESSIFMKRI